MSAGTTPTATIRRGSWSSRTPTTCRPGTATCRRRMRSSTGQWVRQGQVIGYEGNTGHSTGPHLHYMVRVDGVVPEPAPVRVGRAVRRAGDRRCCTRISAGGGGGPGPAGRAGQERRATRAGDRAPARRSAGRRCGDKHHVSAVRRPAAARSDAGRLVAAALPAEPLPRRRCRLALRMASAVAFALVSVNRRRLASGCVRGRARVWRDAGVEADGRGGARRWRRRTPLHSVGRAREARRAIRRQVPDHRFHALELHEFRRHRRRRADAVQPAIAQRPHRPRAGRGISTGTRAA